MSRASRAQCARGVGCRTRLPIRHLSLLLRGFGGWVGTRRCGLTDAVGELLGAAVAAGAEVGAAAAGAVGRRTPVVVGAAGGCRVAGGRTDSPVRGPSPRRAAGQPPVTP